MALKVCTMTAPKRQFDQRFFAQGRCARNQHFIASKLGFVRARLLEAINAFSMLQFVRQTGVSAQPQCDFRTLFLWRVITSAVSYRHTVFMSSGIRCG